MVDSAGNVIPPVSNQLLWLRDYSCEQGMDANYAQNARSTHTQKLEESIASFGTSADTPTIQYNADVMNEQSQKNIRRNRLISQRPSPSMYRPRESDELSR